MSTKITIPPIEVEIDGIKCVIVEISSHVWIDNKTHYIASVKCENSQIFQVDAVNNEELIGKLRAEVAKMKLIKLLT